MVVIHKFSKFGWTIGLKNVIAQPKEAASENILKSCKIERHLLETDDGSESVNKLFTNLLNYKNIRRYSGNTSLGAVFAERFNGTARDLLKKPVFEKRDGSWQLAVGLIIYLQEQNNKITEYILLLI